MPGFGDIPIVAPIEPMPGEGLVGEQTEEYHNYLCRTNWIGYQLTDGKLKYAGDWNFFKIDEEYYRDVNTGYQKAKKYFLQHGLLHPYYGKDRNPVRGKEIKKLANLGGFSADRNWAHSSDFPLKVTKGKANQKSGESLKWLPDVVVPFTSDNRTFEYIGLFNTYSYINGEDSARWSMSYELIRVLRPSRANSSHDI